MTSIETIIGFVTAFITGGVLQEIVRGLFSLRPGSRQAEARKRNIEKVRDFDAERERRWAMEDYNRQIVQILHRETDYDINRLPPWPYSNRGSNPITEEITLKSD